MARRVDDAHLQYQGEFWPRDHGKSEIYCISYPLRAICENPDVRILIIQKTATEAKKTLAVIKAELEKNREMKAFYADHWEATVGHRDISNATGVIDREGEREGAWQQSRIYVKRNRRGKDPTVEAVGVGGAITGGHFDIIILDDVEDDENTRTASRLKWLLQWFSGTIMQLREPHTKILVVGTLKTNGPDIYNFILKNPLWSCRVVPAILSHELSDIEYKPIHNEEGVLVEVEIETEDVRTLWPQKWPIRALIKEMLASVRSIWIREKLNDLRALAGRIFKSEWFRYFDEIGDYDHIVQAWDTAWEDKEGADWSVCITAGLRGGTVDILDVFRARLETPELLEAMKAQYKRWKPEVVLIEDKASGKSALQMLKRETTLPIVAVNPGTKDKVARARPVTPYYESGRVRHRTGTPWLDVFEDELVLFPESENDDQVDALVYALMRLFGLFEELQEERTESAQAQAVSRETVFGSA
jgi:predicted phage terminase large subunit-like protein